MEYLVSIFMVGLGILMYYKFKKNYIAQYKSKTLIIFLLIIIFLISTQLINNDGRRIEEDKLQFMLYHNEQDNLER